MAKNDRIPAEELREMLPRLAGRCEKHNVPLREEYSRSEMQVLCEISPAWASRMLKAERWMTHARKEIINGISVWVIPASDIEDYLDYQEERRAELEAAREDPRGYYRASRRRMGAVDLDKLLADMTEEAKAELLAKLSQK